LLYVVQVRALARAAGASSVQHRDGLIVVQVSGGPSPREVLKGIESDTLWLGQTQARIDIHTPGGAWIEKLRDVLVALGRSNGVAEPETAATRSG
jgi:hypothetical protein